MGWIKVLENSRNLTNLMYSKTQFKKEIILKFKTLLSDQLSFLIIPKRGSCCHSLIPRQATFLRISLAALKK